MSLEAFLSSPVDKTMVLEFRMIPKARALFRILTKPMREFPREQSQCTIVFCTEVCWCEPRN